MATHGKHPAKKNGEAVPLLPIGGVRSVVTINPPTNRRGFALSSSLPSTNGHVGRRRLRGLPFGLGAAANSPSVATASYCREQVNGESASDSRDDRERITVVAACVPPSGTADDHADSNIPTAGRISLATVAESSVGQCRVLGMQYSASDAPFCTVGVASSFHGNHSARRGEPCSIILFGIDSSGLLHSCQVDRGGGTHLLCMQQCHFEDISQSSPKRGKKAKANKPPTPENDALPSLDAMNNLSARLESASDGGEEHSMLLPETTQSSQPTRSPTKKKGRKRKHSPPRCGSSSSAADTTKRERIYMVASALNRALPSQTPPIVMLMSSDRLHTTGLAWSRVPGLDNVHAPMTCTLFASHATCGPVIWGAINAAIRTKPDSDTTAREDLQKHSDDGVILMGFEDGTLRASLVKAKETTASGDDETENITLEVGRATSLIQLSENEPMVSINLLPLTESAGATRAVLVCAGALGTVVTLSGERKAQFVAENPLKCCGGRWTSLACIGYHTLDETDGRQSAPVQAYIVGINDSGNSYFHRVRLQGGGEARRDDQAGNVDRIGLGSATLRLPISPRATSFVQACAVQLLPSSRAVFSISCLSGKTTVMSIPLVERNVVNQSVRKTNGSQSPLLSALRRHDLSSDSRSAGQRKHLVDHAKGKSASTMHSLLQKLASVTAKQKKSDAQMLLDSMNSQQDRSIKEIREVVQIAACIEKSKDNDLPVKLEPKRLESGVLACAVAASKMPLTREPAASWLYSVHLMQSCTHTLSPLLRAQSVQSLAPLCYRRSTKGDYGLTAVVFAGTANSCSGFDCTRGLEDVRIPMNDLMPMTVYASTSMSYAVESSSGSWKSGNRVLTPDRTVWSPDMTDVFRLSGSAKQANLLGASIPFDLNPRSSNLLFDVLTCASISKTHSDVTSSGSESGARDAAEKCVLQSCQNRSTQGRSQKDYVLPMFKEQQWIDTLRASSNGPDHEKVHCCSSSVRCAISTAERKCINLGFGPVAIVMGRGSSSQHDGHDVAFAIASNNITPNESMSILPLMRQAIIRRNMERASNSMAQKSSDAFKLLESYHLVLTDKQTRKILKHISRSTADLSAKLDSTNERPCPNEVLAATISLYEIMRAIQIPFH